MASNSKKNVQIYFQHVTRFFTIILVNRPIHVQVLFSNKFTTRTYLHGVEKLNSLLLFHIYHNTLTPHSTGRRFRYAHGDLGFYLKLFQIATRFGDMTLPILFQYASTMLPLRYCYDPTTTMKI